MEDEDRVRELSQLVAKEAGERFMKPLYRRGPDLPMIADIPSAEVKGIAYLEWMRRTQKHSWLGVVPEDGDTEGGYVEDYLVATIGRIRKGRGEYIKGLGADVRDKVSRWMRQR